ncbi:MAG TPA: nickel pincer cofactor biosynthesis protein LarC [Blastocatellia bacterium]|nr:nickel pincer cofactor biosynthesis protein LarC [Blastocatellia bacterium]
MRALYFDCFAGASGDMICGSLIDAGADADEMKAQLASLGLGGYEISTERVKRSGIAATKFNVAVDEAAQPHRHLKDIVEIIDRSALGDLTRQRARRAFELLADAEARVHATTRDRVHFHEVGAVDSIIDTVGAMIGFELLGVEHFFASALRVGHGTVKAAHGLMPVPAPATAELLRDIPIYAGDIAGEFVTPTGAAIIASLAEGYGPLPEMKMAKAGYGAGTRDPQDFPNVLRVMLGELPNAGQPSAARDETLVVVETNIDDMNPQAFGFVMDRAFALGALDAYLTATQMKKSRPGVMLTVLCEPERREALIAMLLAETTTLGVRYTDARRRVLARAFETVQTRYGEVRVKVARDGGRTLHFQPEYEDCARLARQLGVPVIEVQSAAAAAYRERLDDQNGELEKE